MKIVIDIPEEIMEYIKNNGCLSVIYNDEVAKAITNGTPLLKGHGRLIDVSQIVYERECVGETDGCWTTRSTPDIDATPTIIEADKEEEG